MKKLITVASLSLSILFAYNLANADDYNKEVKTDTSQKQEPGTSDNMGMKSTEKTETTKTDTSQPGTVDSSKEVSKTMKSCTDTNGVTYRPSEPGFQTCLKAMKKKGEQMSGQSSETMSDSSQNSGMSGTNSNPSNSNQ